LPVASSAATAHSATATSFSPPGDGSSSCRSRGCRSWPRDGCVLNRPRLAAWHEQ